MVNDMTQSPSTPSRIDKLLMDMHGMNPDEARRRREQRGLLIVVGDDVKDSYGLQIALLTAINLGAKCFANNVQVKGSPGLWAAPCQVRLANEKILGDAMRALGATELRDESLLQRRYLLLGDAPESHWALRMTFDGWNVAVGPASEQSRMRERSYCPLASIAAAAMAVGEMFAETTRINITAGRQRIQFSLWQPTLPVSTPGSEGGPIEEFPSALGVFGLGHLGQAYLWAIASLPLASPSDMLLLCDDDMVELPNVETGALLRSNSPITLKTRMASAWLERRGFSTRLLERRVDTAFRRTDKEPLIALSGFDDNRARQWLSNAGFTLMLDSGLGGKAGNFDSIAFRAWPNSRTATELWPLEEETSASHRENPDATANRDCGRVLVDNVAVAVPFVGAIASCIVLAELIKRTTEGPLFDEMRLRVCSMGSTLPTGSSADHAPLMRGIPMQSLSYVDR